MELLNEATTAYLRDFGALEDEHLRAARARSEESDIPAVAQETGGLLRWFARLLNARHVVEVGTGAGYSGLWLVRGMDARGALTTVEVDPEVQTLAQQAFTEAGVGDRVRAMLGSALTVLPKLADAHYDIVFLDAVKTEYPEYLDHARRLLRPGGLLLADNALWHGRVASAGHSDAETSAVRAFNEAVRDDPNLEAAVLPVGDGLLAAFSRPGAGAA